MIYTPNPDMVEPTEGALTLIKVLVEGARAYARVYGDWDVVYETFYVLMGGLAEYVRDYHA